VALLGRRLPPSRPVDAPRRRRRRRSVVIHLLALAIVPSIALPGFAGPFSEDRREEAAAAERIGRAMTLVVELHELRDHLNTEATSAAFDFYSVRFGVPRQVINDMMGGDGLSLPVPESRRVSDEALAEVPADRANASAFRELRAEVEASRRLADRSFDPADQSGVEAWDAQVSYSEVEQSIVEMKAATIDRVATGFYGIGSRRLLTAVAELQRVTNAVDTANQQGVLLRELFAAPSQELLVGVIGELRETTANWRRLSANLPKRLSAEVRASWIELSEAPETETLNRFFADASREGANEIPPLSAPATLDSLRLGVDRGTALAGILQASVTEGRAAALVDARSAQRRADRAQATVVAVLLFTAGLLVLIGGSLRRRLRDLAAAAERFSAGQLEEMPVHGPQEIAVAANALNDAVASLRRVAVQAERLSAGDLDAPELQQAAPGALGTAVHASVQQIVSAAREREKLKQELAHQAAHDDLTRLPNRAETERLLTGALGRAQRGGFRVAVLFIDLDHFKHCNDTLGHAAGDQVLRIAAERMTDAVRPGDTVCRLGGDEFVVVIEPVGNDRSVVEIAERIAAALTQPIDIDGTSVTVTVTGSIGMAMSEPTSDADSLIREADSAMYLAKATSRGSVEIFDDVLRAELHEEAAFAVAMAYALDHDELELHYQPVIDIATGAVTGFEALARWQRPGHGMVSPDQFIPQAEATGLILDIGVWALRQATTQLMEWSAADPTFDPMHVAVNLSGRHLKEASVIEDVRAALEASDLDPARLVIEITESVAIDSATTIHHLTRLADLGVRIALDDFGTGYTSIAQLLNLPAHILKIDRSLVSGTNQDGSPVLSGNTRIIDLIIEIAHSLDLAVIAEGVEETFQLDKLAAANCETAQGYLISRPLPADQIPTWVGTHQLDLDLEAQPTPIA
jgi:diguanylate cyclase (GGDEF)-like protein